MNYLAAKQNKLSDKLTEDKTEHLNKRSYQEFKYGNEELFKCSLEDSENYSRKKRLVENYQDDHGEVKWYMK